MTQQDKEKIISRIIDLEYEITSAIIEGHKSSIDDKFQNKRLELNTLRCLLFGYGSEYCKKIL
jgi:hypothetical protein